MAQSPFLEQLTRVEEMILSAIRMGDFVHVSRELNAFLDLLSSAEVSDEQHLSLCLELVVLSLRTARSTGISPGYFDFERLGALRSKRDRSERAQWIERFVRDLRGQARELSRNSTTARIQRALAYIGNHLDNTLSLERVAGEIGLNKNYLSQVFKRGMGVSFIKYVTNLRIQRSQDLLRQGLLVYQVAKMVGYENDRYFSGLFKRNTGVSPKKFQENRH